MPDETALVQMYGPDYESSFANPFEVSDPKERQRVVEESPHRTGLFVDYGCGAGAVLSLAMDRGWSVCGVEFDETVARNTSEMVGAEVLTAVGFEQYPQHTADVIHFGDVIEHLVNPYQTVTAAIRALKPGGLVIAQGPLENNPSVFNSAVRIWSQFRVRTTLAMPPYHVVLATAAGQRAFFERLGLETKRFEIAEVSWPAPAQAPRLSVQNMRAISLFLLRSVSRRVSRLAPGRLGNRYYYVGTLPQAVDGR